MLNTKLGKEELVVELGLQEGGFYNKDGTINEAAVIRVLCMAVENALIAKENIEGQAINKARSQRRVSTHYTKPERSWLYNHSSIIKEEE